MGKRCSPAGMGRSRGVWGEKGSRCFYSDTLRCSVFLDVVTYSRFLGFFEGYLRVGGRMIYTSVLKHLDNGNLLVTSLLPFLGSWDGRSST